jgi:hypothetical protein
MMDDVTAAAAMEDNQWAFGASVCWECRGWHSPVCQHHPVQGGRASQEPTIRRYWLSSIAAAAVTSSIMNRKEVKMWDQVEF